MRTFIASFCLLLSVLSGFAAEEKGARVAEAEAVAQQYMSAYFHGDFQLAASLTQPETLQQIRKDFERERTTAAAAGKEAEFLAPFAVKASTDLDALSPTEFYVRVTAGLRLLDPIGAAVMKTAVVNIIGSERTGGDRVVVTLAIPLPAGSALPVLDGRLLLACVDNQWKVVGNAP